jgi:uroporphyrin-III C-methyltransferase
MPMTQLAEIAAALQAGGLAAETPAAVIQGASTAAERVVESTLSRVADDAHAAGIGSPAIVVIGAIARLRERLLSGMVPWP